MSRSGTGDLRFDGWWPRAIFRVSPGRVIGAATLLLLSLPPIFVLVHPVAGSLLLVALIISLDEVFLPVHYRIGEDGVELRTAVRTRRHSWAEFTDARATRHGVHLGSPVRRSVHLLAPEEVRGRLTELVGNHLGLNRKGTG